MRQATTQIDGKWYQVLVPDNESDDSKGMIIGPPDLSDLNLSDEVTDRLHMELFVRGLTDKKMALKKRNEVFAALQAALSITVDKILECY